MRDPAVLFCLFSLLFGLAVIAINPPLRGPDESAHFLRIYSVAQGKIVPSDVDDQGRRGLFLPAQLHEDFIFFEKVREEVPHPGLQFRILMRDFSLARAQRGEQDANAPAVFQPYGGSEAYSPASYLPYVAVSFLLQVAGADFVSSIYAMRLAGLIAFTAMATYAIAITPHLKWAFFLIAMLPSALYSRTVLSADGPALSSVLVVTALCLRATLPNANERSVERSLWMTICVAAKPAQVAFLLLEGMTTSLSAHLRRPGALALIILPGLCLTFVWLYAGSIDIGAWRITGETDQARDAFDPVAKLRFMLEHPMHFPAALLQSLDYSVELWRQLIGVLGWLDTYLVPLAYPTLTALTIVTFAEKLQVDSERRYRIAFWCIAAVLAYILAIFLIFYLSWTPIDSDRVLGVQGRYFIVVLPPLALFVAAIVNHRISHKVIASCAICGALVSGAATIAAILKITW